MKRIFLIAGGALLLVIVATVWFGLSRLDSLVASAIEEFGSEIAGVPVRVDSVSIQLREGRGTILGLRAGNPEGFSASDAFSLGEITVDIDPTSITSSPIVIEELTVAAPVAIYEMDAKGRSNFDVIRANVNRYSGDSPASPEGAPADDSGEELRLAVAKFRFQDGSLTADVSAVHEKAEPQKLDLPPLALDGIGGSRGATAGELGTAVLDAFTRSVRDVGKGVAKAQARTLLEDQIGGEEGKAAGRLLDKLF
jgi:hypothetical protein